MRVDDTHWRGAILVYGVAVVAEPCGKTHLLPFPRRTLHLANLADQCRLLKQGERQLRNRIRVLRPRMRQLKEIAISLLEQTHFKGCHSDSPPDAM